MNDGLIRNDACEAPTRARSNVVAFPNTREAARRMKAAAALRSCLAYLEGEARRGHFPLAAELIGAAILSLDEDPPARA